MITLYRVKGHSMEPAVKDGEVYFVANFSSPKINDIVVFENNGMSLVKRVKKIGGNKYILKGDNEGHSKEYQIRKEQVVGKLAFRLWPLAKR